MQKSPYKFLDSYSREDRHIFFGRDKEIEELHSRVFESRVLVLYGTSGTGKSSLINCGLANKFNDSDWMPVTVRRGTDINRSLFESLGKVSLTDLSPDTKNQAGTRKSNIVKFIQSIYLDHFKPVFIIFDQFEELFIFGDSEERNELTENVRKVLDSDLQCRFIFSVREEYLAGFTDFERAIPSILQNRMRIEKMTRQNAIKVIEGPCHINSIEVEPGFPEALLGKLNPESPDVELTFLQVYLDRIFRIASGDGREVKRINAPLLEEAGEVKDLLGSFLEEQISQLDDPDSGMVVLKSFVSVKGTRHQITEEEVIEYSKTLGKDIGKEKSKDLIQKFIRLRILRDKDENGRYELRHDSLASKIYEKITLVEKELLEIRQFLENALNIFEKRQMCLTAEDLSYIAPYEDKLFLSEKLQKFISQSKWYLQKARRRRQSIFISSAAVIIVILLFFTFWAMRERSNAIDQRQIADDQRIAALKAKEEADSSSRAAIAARNLAVEKENQAVLSQKQAEDARRSALAQREYAVSQKRIADEYSVKAGEQAQIATEEKNKAELERTKAVAAESEATRLGLLSKAQALALKSMNITLDMERVPELAGLLAVQAYRFHTENGGAENDPIIFEALLKAWTRLDSSKHHIFRGSPNEIVTMADKDGVLLTADYDGVVRAWKSDGSNNIVKELSVKEPVDIIHFSPSGKYLLYGSENSEWFLKSTIPENISEQKIEIKSTGIGTAVFSWNEEFLAASSGDSLVRIWKLGERNVKLLKEIKLPGPVKLIEFYGTDSIVSVYPAMVEMKEVFFIQWNSVKSDKSFRESFSPNYRPICLAYNHSGKNLFVGLNSGQIKIFNNKQFSVSGSKSYSIDLSGIDRIVFNRDGSRVVISLWNKTIRIIDNNTFFNLDNENGSIFQVNGLSTRTRTMIFDSTERLVTALGDKTLRFWEIYPEKICSGICSLVGRSLNYNEWRIFIGNEIPYQRTCRDYPLTTQDK